ncbi:MAG: hypothetical protein ACP5HS_12635 [Anaerolineae bacterium]
MSEETVETRMERETRRRARAEALVARLRKVLPAVLNPRPVVAAFNKRS